jgi:hypothetical protein
MEIVWRDRLTPTIVSCVVSDLDILSLKFLCFSSSFLVFPWLLGLVVHLPSLSLAFCGANQHNATAGLGTCDGNLGMLL